MALLRQLWHGLTRFHRLETARDGWFVTYRGCECGAVFSGKRPDWMRRP